MIRELCLALRACAVTFVLCAVAYPAVVWGMAQLLFPSSGRGSLIYGADHRTVIGSELIAQRFESDQYFHPRPSAVDYKADAAGGSNLGTENPDLRKTIAERAEALAGDAREPGSGRPGRPRRDRASIRTSARRPRITRRRASRPPADVLEQVRALIERAHQSIGRDPGAPAAGQRAVLNLLSTSRARVLSRPIAGGEHSVRHGIACARSSHSPHPRAVPEPDPPPGAGPAQGLPGLGGRRGQDVCDAPRGTSPQGAGRRRRRSGWSRPTAAPRPPSRSATSRSSRPARSNTAASRSARWTSTPSWLAGPRSAWSTSSPTPMPRAARHPKRYQDVEDLLHAGNPRDHDRQRPASREPVRRDRAGDRRQGQGAPPRSRPGRGRPDRQRRRLGRRPDRAAEDRQDLPGRTGSRTALENFFTPSNLTRLREITLTEIAHLIDRRNRRAEADQYPALGDRPRDGRTLQPQPQRAGAAAQDRPDRRPAECSMVRRVYPDSRQKT